MGQSRGRDGEGEGEGGGEGASGERRQVCVGEEAGV